MTDSRKVIKIFLASPGDLGDERKATKTAVDEINQTIANALGYQVELVGWEDTVSKFGRPQSVINRELARCEYFIGLMWRRWGTAPAVSGEFTSGFEEEFQTSVKRRLADGTPEISMFFKRVEEDHLRDPGDELKKVLAFKAKLEEEKQILFQVFADSRDLESKVRVLISNYLFELWNQETSKALEQSQVPITEGSQVQSAAEPAAEHDSAISAQATAFLRDFITKTGQGTGNAEVTALDAAHFRLVGSTIGTQGNDEQSIGVHDANIIFANRTRIDLGRSELVELLRFGLMEFKDEIAPLWHWLSALDGFKDHLLGFYSIIGSSDVRKIAALDAMRLVSEPMPPGHANGLKRDYFFEYWFSKDSASAIKTAALRYLRDCGGQEDLPIIRQQFESGDNQTTIAAAEAIICIHLRDSRENAIVALYELQPTSISSRILQELFKHEEALSNDLLMRGIGHANAEVRRIVVKALHRRHALQNEVAEQLLIDPDPFVRTQALLTLIESGRELSESECKQIILDKEKPGSIGILGKAFDRAAEVCWKDFQKKRLHLLSIGALQTLASVESIFERNARFILVERQFKQHADDLRNAVDDNFNSEFAKQLSTLGSSFGENQKLVQDIRKLQSYLCATFTHGGIEILCKRMDARDVGRIREKLRSKDFGYSAIAIDYLRKVGEWNDIPIIIEMVERLDFSEGNSLLGSVVLEEKKYKHAAKALIGLGGKRVDELVQLTMSPPLFSSLLAELPEKAFRSISESTIKSFLKSEIDAIRKSVVLNCIRALPKAQVAKLLEDYISGQEFRYYNVVHWLDFGVSVPKERAVIAVKKILDGAWSH